LRESRFLSRHLIFHSNPAYQTLLSSLSITINFTFNSLTSFHFSFFFPQKLSSNPVKKFSFVMEQDPLQHLATLFHSQPESGSTEEFLTAWSEFSSSPIAIPTLMTLFCQSVQYSLSPELLALTLSSFLETHRKDPIPTELQLFSEAFTFSFRCGLDLILPSCERVPLPPLTHTNQILYSTALNRVMQPWLSLYFRPSLHDLRFAHYSMLVEFVRSQPAFSPFSVCQLARLLSMLHLSCSGNSDAIELYSLLCSLSTPFLADPQVATAILGCRTLHGSNLFQVIVDSGYFWPQSALRLLRVPEYAPACLTFLHTVLMPLNLETVPDPVLHQLLQQTLTASMDSLCVPTLARESLYFLYIWRSKLLTDPSLNIATWVHNLVELSFLTTMENFDSAPFDFWSEAYGDAKFLDGATTREIAQKFLGVVCKEFPIEVFNLLSELMRQGQLLEPAVRSVITFANVLEGEIVLELVNLCFPLATSDDPFLRCTVGYLAGVTLPLQPQDIGCEWFLSAAKSFLGNELHPVRFTVAVALLANLVERCEVPEELIELVYENHTQCATGDVFELLKAIVKVNPGRTRDLVMITFQELHGELVSQDAEYNRFDDAKRLECEKVETMIDMICTGLQEAEERIFAVQDFGTFLTEIFAMPVATGLYFEECLDLAREFVAYATRFDENLMDAGIPQVFEAWFQYEAASAFTMDVGNVVFKCFTQGFNTNHIELKKGLLDMFLSGLNLPFIHAFDRLDEDACIFVTIICRLLQLLRGAEIEQQIVDLIRLLMSWVEGLTSSSDEEPLKSLLITEIMMSLAYVGVLGIEPEMILGQIENIGGLVSNYHRKLFLQFLLMNGVEEQGIYDEIMSGIQAKDNWIHNEYHQVFDTIVMFFPEMGGFEEISIQPQISSPDEE
jgi:hypothetical protein